MSKFSVAALSLILPIRWAHAGSETVPASAEAASSFDRGQHELQIGLGYGFSSVSTPPQRPRLDDLTAAVRYGWMLNSPAGHGFFRGNTEVLVEGVGGAVTAGPRGVLVGGTLIFRYNFVQPGAHWIPYVQAGLGAIYTDIYRQRPQRLIGQAFEFTVQGELGLRYEFSAHHALYVETGYRHISNAGLDDRNYGLNSLVLQAGVSWLW